MTESTELLDLKSHFALGKNWENYARHVGEEQVAEALASLRRLAGAGCSREALSGYRLQVGPAFFSGPASWSPRGCGGGNRSRLGRDRPHPVGSARARQSCTSVGLLGSGCDEYVYERTPLHD
jgi:hypothetical protein